MFKKTTCAFVAVVVTAIAGGAAASFIKGVADVFVAAGSIDAAWGLAILSHG